MNESAQNPLPLPFPNTVRWRVLEFFTRVLEVLFLPEFMMSCNRIFKRSTRSLTPREIALGEFIFGQSIDFQKVRMDERSHIGCRRHHFAYVGFHFINSWGSLSDAVFIHELVHVWQFEKFGALYIPRALFAQTTSEGYNYGGIKKIRAARSAGLKLTDFNYEQQGEIVADYFRLRVGQHPNWCAHDPRYLPDFEYFMEEIWA